MSTVYKGILPGLYGLSLLWTLNIRSGLPQGLQRSEKPCCGLEPTARLFPPPSYFFNPLSPKLKRDCQLDLIVFPENIDNLFDGEDYETNHDYYNMVMDR